MKHPHTLPTGRRRQRGAVIVMFGLTLVMLIGFIGLAIDLGRFFVVKSELQNAMDACALSAASQLRPGQNDVNALTRAVAYGRVFTTGGTADNDAIKNRANFQSGVVEILPTQITFSPTLNGNYNDSATATANTATYAKCEYPLAGLPIYFMQVLNLIGLGPFTTQTVSAMAVATRGPQICNVIPVGICPPTGGLQPGTWIPLMESGVQGRFSWVQYAGPGGGTDVLRDALTQSGSCDIPIGTVGQDVSEAGKKTAAELGWNSRFGLYRNGAGNPQKDSAPPDFTGRAYVNTTNGGDTINWPRLDTDTAPLAYNGTNGATVNFQAAQDGFFPFNGTTNLSGYGALLTPSEHQTYGRNRRVVIAPIIEDCTSATRKVEDFACTLMLNPFSSGGGSPSAVGKLEYLGLVSDPSGPCGADVTGPLISVLVK